jgi:hypothetical protein
MPHIERLRQAEPSSVEIAVLNARALELAGDRGRALQQYHELLAADVRCQEAYQGLVRGATGPIAASAATILELLGASVDERTGALLQRLASVHGPVGVLPPEMIGTPPSELQLEELVHLLMRGLAEAFPRPPGQHAAASHPVAGMAGRIARALGIQAVNVEIGGGSGVSLAFGEPLTLEVGKELAASPDSPELRTALAHAIALGPTGAILHRLDLQEQKELADAVSGRKPVLPGGQRLRKSLLASLTRKERKELEQLELGGALDLATFIGTRQPRADRAAVVLSCHPGAAIRTLARAAATPLSDIYTNARFVALLRYAVTEDYDRAFRTVWGNVT